MKVVLVLMLCISNTGCGWLIAGQAIDRHYSVREREVEYRHQERMRELDIQERQLRSPLVRDNPF